MGIFLANLGELVPRALPTHVSKNLEATQARAPNSLCVAWCLPGQYLLSLRKRASMELIFPAILSWLLFGRKFVLLVRGEPRGRGCMGQCYHRGRQPTGKRQHIGRRGIRGVRKPPKPKYVRMGIGDQKNNYGSANQSWLVRKLHLHPDVVGVYVEAIQVFRPSGNDGNYEICTMAIGA